jgi:hypothetical protein
LELGENWRFDGLKFAVDNPVENLPECRTMKILFYFLMLVFGLYGALAVLRTIELLVTGGGFNPVTLLLGIVGLVLAGACLKKARANSSRPK